MSEQVDIEAVLEYALLHVAEPARHNFRIMFHWFMNGGSDPSDRLYGKRIPGVDRDFSHCAQRGIHVPGARWFLGGAKQYAASITARVGSLYDSSGRGEPFVELEDGTWVILYSAHRNNKGNQTYSGWNDSLQNNLLDMVPVGVFRQVRPQSDGYLRSLAWVESYDATSDTFVIHGPVTAQTQQLLQPDVFVEDIDLLDKPSAVQLLEDERVRRRANLVVRKGQAEFRSDLLEAYEGHCALSGCDVPQVLQAAHIIDFHGRLSNRVDNGILLREDIHTLFDRALFGINPQTRRVQIGSRLISTEYEELQGRKLALPRSQEFLPSEEYLAAKYKNFERACANVA